MQESRKEIYTSEKQNLPFVDLKYKGPDNKYSFELKYLERGIFIITSKGYVDEEGIAAQIKAGDEARVWLSQTFPNESFHLLWNVSELQGSSTLARYKMMHKASITDTFGSINIIGANSLVKSFAKIVYSIIPHIKIFFFNETSEAIAKTIQRINGKEPPKTHSNYIANPKNETYNKFIDLWKKNPEYLEIDNQKLKIIRLTSWKYTAEEKNFSIEFSLLEGNIIVINCKGSIRIANIEKTYQILKEIMSQFGYTNSRNKFYTIVDLKSIKGITLNARKLTQYYENLYKERSHLVIMIPSPILHFALLIQKKINTGSFSHWIEESNLSNAVSLIKKHKIGQFSLNKYQEPHYNEELKLPETKEELAKLATALYKENQLIKQHQNENIQRILEITGRMTWDESFSGKLEFLPDENSPFTDVFNALSVVHEDFREILKEKLVHANKLKESEEKYRNLITLASDIIVVYQDGLFKLINSRVTDVIGYTSEEAKTKSPEDFLHPEELPKIIELIENADNKTSLYFEAHLIHKTKKIIPVSISSGEIIYENKPARMFIIRDITAKKIAEAELEKYRSKLEEMVAERSQQLKKEIIERESAEKSDRLKSAFLSNMSHEIRTPMNAIIAFSNFLRNSNLTKEQRDEYINYIQSSGESLLNLINDIIDISKIEAKQISVQKINCEVNTILDELYILFEETRKSKGCAGLSISLIKNFQSNNLILHTDPYRLKQILSNLLHNALKFTERGSIEFGYTIQKDTIDFFVKDSGIGIPQEKLDFIFQRFGKIEYSGKNRGGTGLGLAISQNLATILGGKLSVESTFGVGSTFYLSLPYQGEQILDFNTKLPDYIEKEFYNWDHKKILVAEDEDLNFKVIQIALKDTYAQIIRAYDGQEALEITKKYDDIDLVLMDIQMPVMDGYEAFSKIRQIRNIPVIAQTAFALIEEKEKCLRYGFSDYIAKPLKISELLKKIDKFI